LLVSSAFTKAIADTFYDKTFTIAATTHGKDAEGGATTIVGSPVTHKGNVQYNLSQRAIELYGLIENVDLAITTSTSVSVKADDRVTYNSVTYVVTSVKPFDSHILIIGSKR